MRVPDSGPAVTTRCRGPRVPRAPRLRPAAAARGGTEGTRPARPPSGSARTTGRAAKMKSKGSSRNPKRKPCRTISAISRPFRRGARSRAVLPVDQHGVADPDDVAVGELLVADPPAVDQGAVGGAQVLDGDR